MNKDMKILIADDSEFMRRILKDILAGAGFSQIVEAHDGDDALQKYESEKPDLVLLDIVMGEVSGLDVLKKIGRFTKVVVISASGQDGMIKDAKAMGALGYVLKPFDNSQVVKEVEKALHGNR